MLFALRNYMQRHHLVSSEQLTREFSISMEALEPILDIWIARGFIKKMQKSSACGTSCGPCGSRRPRLEYYTINAHAVRSS